MFLLPDSCRCIYIEARDTNLMIRRILQLQAECELIQYKLWYTYDRDLQIKFIKITCHMISLERIINRYVTRKPERELWYEIMVWNYGMKLWHEICLMTMCIGLQLLQKHFQNHSTQIISIFITLLWLVTIFMYYFCKKTIDNTCVIFNFSFLKNKAWLA